MKRTLIFALGFTSLLTVIIFSCKKINMATELGQGLIPAVDNVNTFDTTLEVDAYNNLFTAANDTFRSYPAFNQILGVINNDPIFGKTDARMFFQVAPGTKAPFKNKPEKLTLDSVVLIVKHVGTYGDTLLPQTIQVSEIDQPNDFKSDTAYFLTKNVTANTVLGSKTFLPASFDDSIRVINYPDTITVANQLRIKLDNSFGQRLLAYDSTGVNDAYSTDSLFRTKFKGFALQSIAGGNALMGFDLSNTRLAVYYKYENATTAGDIDTSVAFFSFPPANTETKLNANANYIERDYNSTPLQTALASTGLAPEIFIQNTPGTYATLKIPGLANFQPSIIHLAELQMESLYDQSDTMFNAPNNLFLDVYDSSISKFKLIPYVFNFTLGSTGSYIISNYYNFYSARTQSQTYYYIKNPSGNTVKQWRFNITGYVQHIATAIDAQKIPLYNFRLYAPAFEQLPAGNPDASSSVLFTIPQENFGRAGIGRIRLGGGNHPTQKMKLRIIYSKT